MQSNLIDICTFRMYRLEILSSAATYKRMKTELLYWPRRVARVWTKLNLLSDHSPSGPMLDFSTGQRKGECLSMLSSGFTSAFSILSEMSKCDNCYIPDDSNPAAAMGDARIYQYWSIPRQDKGIAEPQHLCSACEHRGPAVLHQFIWIKLKKRHISIFSKRQRAGIKYIFIDCLQSKPDRSAAGHCGCRAAAQTAEPAPGNHVWRRVRRTKSTLMDKLHSLPTHLSPLQLHKVCAVS